MREVVQFHEKEALALIGHLQEFFRANSSSPLKKLVVRASSTVSFLEDCLYHSDARNCHHPKFSPVLGVDFTEAEAAPQLLEAC
mmetsp:Transcript_15581/g.23899  ORF Transcript_15581/g.23899 Transcript_15581/m.23899 type:complete len:84 (-) Transcript_15581:683-934(-)